MSESCAWAVNDPLALAYHDEEWGVPVFDDRKMFEMLTLSVFQAGLSWMTVLRKRENFRRAFADFDAEVIARFDEAKVQALLQNASILRNQQKIRATIANAGAVLRVCETHISFSDYLWRFVEYKPIVSRLKSLEAMPVQSDLSRKLSTDMKSRGFKFVGPRICYAFIQSVGLINDHMVSCFRFAEICRIYQDLSSLAGIDGRAGTLHKAE